VADNYEAELKKDEASIRETMTLEDGTDITLGKERFSVPEVSCRTRVQQ
jgi:hypothetical protein